MKRNIFRNVLAAAIAASSFTVSADGSGQSGDLAYADNLKLLAYNVFLLPSAVAKWSESERADLIADSDVIDGYDVIIFSELFHNSASNKLLKKIKDQYPHQTPVLGRSLAGWDQTLGAYTIELGGESITLSLGGSEDGGVSIVSRWPIEEQVQYIYTEACSASDESANKGFVYVRLNKNGEDYHVIGTHTQADSYEHPFPCSTGNAAVVRAAQFKEMHDFITERNIPADEVVFIGGDMNVVKESDEYPQMLQALNANGPGVFAGKRFSWDPATNGITNYNYGSYSGQQLDYILTSARHAQPTYWHNLTLDPSSPVWFDTYNFQEYSDHYPVAAFAYADATTRTSSYRATNEPYRNVRIRSNANNRYIAIDASSSNGWITATGSAGDSTTSMLMDNWYPSDRAFCIRNNDFISVQGNDRADSYWNWFGTAGGGQYAYFTDHNDPSNRLRVRILNDDGDCLKNGDQVAFIDGDTLNTGAPDYALRVWPDGTWQNHIYLWTDVNSIGSEQTFTVEMGAPLHEDWSNQLRYAQ